MNSSISMNSGVELIIFHPTLDFIEPFYGGMSKGMPPFIIET